MCHKRQDVIEACKCGQEVERHQASLNSSQKRFWSTEEGTVDLRLGDQKTPVTESSASLEAFYCEYLFVFLHRQMYSEVPNF